mmetsp:Transcript_31951/g.98954  ORF Transcript_31951/g.98954 Transcript_31951/m.98954 type:complete len:414 (-) Transcript_31951:917-2158(-)
MFVAVHRIVVEVHEAAELVVGVPEHFREVLGVARRRRDLLLDPLVDLLRGRRCLCRRRCLGLALGAFFARRRVLRGPFGGDLLRRLLATARLARLRRLHDVGDRLVRRDVLVDAVQRSVAVVQLRGDEDHHVARALEDVVGSRKVRHSHLAAYVDHLLDSLRHRRLLQRREGDLPREHVVHEQQQHFARVPVGRPVRDLLDGADDGLPQHGAAPREQLRLDLGRRVVGACRVVVACFLRCGRAVARRGEGELINALFLAFDPPAGKAAPPSELVDEDAHVAVHAVARAVLVVLQVLLQLARLGQQLVTLRARFGELLAQLLHEAQVLVAAEALQLELVFGVLELVLERVHALLEVHRAPLLHGEAPPREGAVEHVAPGVAVAVPAGQIPCEAFDTVAAAPEAPRIEHRPERVV